MPIYSILQDGGHYDDMNDLNNAIDLAEILLGGVPDGEKSTFTVENEEGHLMAAVTNRRIVGHFLKQQWDSGDNAISMGEEDFDATDYILLMKPDDVRALEDNRETTDRIGQAHVSWDGPHQVTVQDSICEFFGVSSVKEITDEAMAYAKNRLDPRPATEQTVKLSVKVTVRVVHGASVSEFVNNLDCSVISNTTGITVQSTEIVASD